MRLKVVSAIYYLAIIAIVLRLAYWQLLKADELVARAEGQRVVSTEVMAPRGDILFADRSVLATTQPSFLVFAQPRVVAQVATNNKTYPKQIAQTLAEVFWNKNHLDQVIDEAEKKKQLEQIEGGILEKLNQNLYWISLGEKVDFETKSKLEKLDFKGIGFEQSSTRFYPEGSSSAHLLGFVAADIYGNETGYFGLEGFYNGELKGKKGNVVSEKDALGLPILIGTFINQQPKKGKTVVLNVDRAIQHIVETKLALGMQKYGAKAGSVVIMDPKTGNILAMASLPSYDPAVPDKYPKENYRNPITADGYEPGSTFKVMVMSAALNENLVKPDTICDICDGPVSVGGYTIKTWNGQYRPGSNMTDIIIHSDNVGMVFISKKLGIDKMYDYLTKFGFGESTGADLQDEQVPDLRPKSQWHEIDLATSSFGQGISVTALQILRAVGAIANGGKLMEPHLVSSISDDQKTFNISPRVISTPISEQTAKSVTEMMVRAVSEGEAKFAKPEGFKVAGKTGTAQIPVAGHYDANKTVASFVGFAPPENPKFVMLVRYLEPSSSIFGAETAAPTFFDIAKELFTYYGIAPNE